MNNYYCHYCDAFNGLHKNSCPMLAQSNSLALALGSLQAAGSASLNINQLQSNCYITAASGFDIGVQNTTNQHKKYKLKLLLLRK